MSNSITDLTNDTCLTPGCGRRRTSEKYRGLCLPCYSKAKAAVAEGRTTWGRLEQLGLTLPADDPFTAALRRAEQEGK